MTENEDLEDDKKQLLQCFLEQEEAGFIRLLCFCLMSKRCDLRMRPRVLKNIKDAIWSLKVKRILNKMTDEELINLGLDPTKKDIFEGWTLNKNIFDFWIQEVMK